MYEYGLQIFWFLVIIASVVFYAMLDGFDLGVGALHLFAKKDHDRRIFLNSIGPVWDGNEVWLVILVGGLFAGFPYAYATLFSAFYVPLTILIFGLIFRAVAIEFRSKRPSKLWRVTWDALFFAGSVLIALLVGAALGNLVIGMPLDQDHLYVGKPFFDFIRPYPVLVGVLTLSLFMMHGCIYLVMKTEGELQAQIKNWVTPTTIFFIMAYAITTMVTLIYYNHMVTSIRERPYLFVIALLNMLAIANIPRLISKHRYGWAFIFSCINIGLLLTLFAIGMFPYILRSTIHPAEYSLTVMNSAASTKTLVVLTGIAVVGIPLVLAYFYTLYRIFHGKVHPIDSHSY